MMMQKEIKSSIVINTSLKEVWDVLVDFDSYPDWNPFILFAKGRVEKNETINIKIKPVGRSPFSFTPMIKEVVEERKVEWAGKAFIKGLFDGKHSFELHANQDGTTTFTQSEFFSGLLIPFCEKMIEIDTLNGFVLMNEALKERSEKKTL